MEIFNKEYIQSILKPFEGKRLRMRSESDDKLFQIPFLLETSIETPFQFEFTNIGIKFLLKDDFYIKRDIKILLNQAILKTGLYPHTLDNLLKDKEGKVEDNAFQKIINEYFDENFKPQIAFTYYGMIKSLKVSKDGFVMNKIEFITYD